MRRTAEELLREMTEIENGLWEEGYAIAGMDEVGRGPLAGPVVTACVSIPKGRLVPGVNDSKKLSEKKRESLYGAIRDAADYCETAFLSREVVDDINILQATRRAMEACAAGFYREKGIILVDAIQNLDLPCESRGIVHGDELSYMIAAASVVAKVERDRYMVELDAKYPQYGFARNKGYGTEEHIAALREYGPCPAHRRSFIGKIIYI